MKLDLKNLPNETKLLHQIITDLIAENQSLQEQLKLLKRKNFGSSSEKIKKKIEEIELRLEETESSALAALLQANEGDDDETKFDTDTTKDQPKRKKLPEHLERINVLLNPDPKCPECDGGNFRKISDDISEILEYIPSSFKVIRHIRARCVCTNCDKIVQAYAPSNTIDKGKAGPGLLSHILVQKYCNHLPMYRQSEIYEREGIELARSTMANWAGQVARLLEPLIEEIRKSVLSSTQIHGDDTTVKVLAPGLGKTKTGRIWTYVRDGRPHGDTTTPPAVCYFYSPDRKGIRPKEHLKDFKGILHADAYAGYDRLYEKHEDQEAQILEAACWSHTRHNFYEVTVVSDNASIAVSTLEQMAKIYEIEDRIRGLTPDERLERRQMESKDLVDKLFIFWKKALHLLPAKSRTAKAINYAINNQEALMRFLTNGKIEIDNNAAERAMRSIAIGRKNWLFAGSDKGGETAANIYTIMETLKLNKINPWKYLSHVLAHIQDHSSTKIAELLPWNVKLE